MRCYRLLQATFEIDDLRRFATDFCKQLKTAKTELSTDLLEDVLAECAKTCSGIENLTILVDESGRLPKLLNMRRGDGDEFSALRSSCTTASVNTLGFSVMLMQAGLGDFAEQAVTPKRCEGHCATGAEN